MVINRGCVRSRPCGSRASPSTWPISGDTTRPPSLPPIPAANSATWIRITIRSGSPARPPSRRTPFSFAKSGMEIPCCGPISLAGESQPDHLPHHPEPGSVHEGMGLGILLRGALLRRGVLKSLSEYSEGSRSEGFAGGQGGEAGASPQRVCNGRANAGHRQRTARRVSETVRWLRYSSVTDPCGYAPPSRLAIRTVSAKTGPPLSIRTGSNLQSPLQEHRPPGRQGRVDINRGGIGGNLLSRRWQRQRESWDGQGGMVQPAPRAADPNRGWTVIS